MWMCHWSKVKVSLVYLNYLQWNWFLVKRIEVKCCLASADYQVCCGNKVQVEKWEYRRKVMKKRVELVVVLVARFSRQRLLRDAVERRVNESREKCWRGRRAHWERGGTPMQTKREEALRQLGDGRVYTGIVMQGAFPRSQFTLIAYNYKHEWKFQNLSSYSLKMN